MGPDHCGFGTERLGSVLHGSLKARLMEGGNRVKSGPLWLVCSEEGGGSLDAWYARSEILTSFRMTRGSGLVLF